MKKIIFIILFSIFVPHIALAQQPSTMQSAVCKLLEMQNVKSLQRTKIATATYQEGIDAYGNEVAPANIDTQIPKQSVIIPIEIDLAKKFDIPNIENIGDAAVGQAEIKPNGRVIFGENDITSKMHDWCGTVVPDDLDIIDIPKIEKPVLEEIKKPIIKPQIDPKIEPVETLNNNNQSSEMIEIKPTVALPPKSTTTNLGSNDPSTIQGTDYRDYNE